MLRFDLKSVGMTESLGTFVGSMLGPGSFLALKGPLGAGKTCFARGVVSSLAPESAHLVSSPTYAIMNSYAGDIPVYHFDFYRLASADQIYELGFEDYFYGNGVCIVEWAERLGDLCPADYMMFQFDYPGDDTRGLTVAAYGAGSDGIMDRLSHWSGEKTF